MSNSSHESNNGFIIDYTVLGLREGPNGSPKPIFEDFSGEPNGALHQPTESEAERYRRISSLGVRRDSVVLIADGSTAQDREEAARLAVEDALRIAGKGK